MTALMGHRIHPDTEKVISTAIRAAFEGGLFDGLATLLEFLGPKSIPQMDVKVKTLQSLQGPLKEDNVPAPLDLHKMKQFLRAWQYIWCLAVITLALEGMYPPVKKFRRKHSPRVHRLSVATH